MIDKNAEKEKVKQLLNEGFCDVEICKEIGLNWDEFWGIFQNIYKNIDENKNN
ncbi:hypothetical protein [Clostridium algifaecis]|uniref:hypothetical protein n=1 Tax=Clostridium algifaecis TaxID=1472040 RepID=UPI001AE836C0|nr:hypothetical protein [Clostridium algifaecis]